MKKRLRKNNPLKRKLALVRAIVKNHLVCFVGGADVMLASGKTGSVRPATENEINCLSEFRHKWSVLLGVLGIDNDDQLYLKSTQMDFQGEYYQPEIADVCAEHHTKLVRNFNPLHFKNVCYLASAHPVDISEPLAMQIFINAGGFNSQVEIVSQEENQAA